MYGLHMHKPWLIQPVGGLLSHRTIEMTVRKSLLSMYIARSLFLPHCSLVDDQSAMLLAAQPMFRKFR